MEFYERISGARMHAAFYRPNEVNLHCISYTLLEDILEFSRNCFTTLNEMHNILTYNKIWKHRLVNVGVYSSQTCLDYSLTGVMSRSVGIKRDLRLSKLETYAGYYFLNFRGFLGQHGDCYDRFLIRMNEMAESLNIINQIIHKITKYKEVIKSKNAIKKNTNLSVHSIIKHTNKKLWHYNNYKNNYNSMESLIKHFKNWSEGDKIASN